MIVLVNRATEDWDQLNLDNYFDKPRPYIYNGGEEREFMLTNLNNWSQYKLDFFQYRHRLKQIAQKKCRLPCIDMDEALTIKDPNVILVPIDDDDIIHPYIDDMIEYHYDYNVDSVSWTTWEYSVLKEREPLIKQHEFPFNNMFHAILVPSNCYSIRSTVATKEILMDHDKFSAIRSISKLHIPQELAIRFTHPGGVWLMQHKITFGEDLIYNEIPPLPKEVEWGRWFIEEATTLTSAIFAKTP